MKRVLLYGACGLTLLLLLCIGLRFLSGLPSKDEVKNTFLREHPNYTVVSVGTTEGDFDNVYFRIQYRRPGENQTFEEEWLYQDRGDEKWTFMWRGQLERAGAVENAGAR